MNIIRVHHRSRKRILIANVLSMIVIGPFVFGIASLWSFQGPAMWLACVLFVVNLVFFSWNTWTVANQRRDFVCLLTDERFVCQSPDETMARSFDLSILEIEKLLEVEQMEGGPKYTIQSRGGGSYALTHNFGNPAWAFFEELQRMLPSVPVEKS